MKKTDICILLDPAHGKHVAGKKSPDGELKEYLWSRKMCDRLVEKLRNEGYRILKITDSEEEIGLANRVQICNNYCSIFGKKNVVFISIHCNAAGSDGKWKKAQGWCVFVAKVASEESKKLAEMFFDEIEKQDIKTRKPLPKQKYWEQNFYVIKNTKCPACLVETLFMDNKEDCEFLLSKEGQEKIFNAYYNAIKEYIKYKTEQTQ